MQDFFSRINQRGLMILISGETQIQYLGVINILLWYNPAFASEMDILYPHWMRRAGVRLGSILCQKDLL
ncbi:MAG: hypothetical protein A2Y88_00995 [Chloroflexi bacterium RBG_13_48_10]|nr:MAG: hypothetical protein A2Y88_00995 [Chloroflexi bacterium RBG_13_48_10]